MNNRPVKVGDAIHSLAPEASFTIYANDYDRVVWDSPDIEKPTLERVENEISRLEAERVALRYREDRKQEYPPIGDQLDALYHAGVFPADMAAQIQAVKDAHPKPNVSV